MLSRFSTGVLYPSISSLHSKMKLRSTKYIRDRIYIERSFDTRAHCISVRRCFINTPILQMLEKIENSSYKRDRVIDFDTGGL